MAGELEDTMESFFLSETTKYLYLLHSNASALADFTVLSTEGHIFFPTRLSGGLDCSGSLSGKAT